MKMLTRAALALSALLACMLAVPAHPQIPASCARADGAYIACVPAVAVTPAANSTPLAGSTTTSAVTPTSGAASISNGVATIGPLAPQLGRPIRLVLRLTAGSSYSAQVFTSPDSCATLNPLTVAGSAWAAYSNAASTINEDVDVPMVSGIGYCLTVTPGSGATVSYAVRQ